MTNTEPTPRLVLTMIVRNESSIIERCLASALPYCDGYVIVDTGSTDDTIPKIQNAVGTLPGAISTETWKDFGTNRTQSAEKARVWVEAQGWDLGTTYLLFLDADMVFHAPEGLKDRLTGPHYRIPQQDSVLRYYNTRIVRLSQRWRSVGVTHEYWAPTPDCEAEHVDFAWIDDVGDGGSKGNKTTRDIALLQQGLESEPDNGRYMFYLGQALFDAHVWDASIDWYERRIAAGGWEEEVWYAVYKLGRAYLERAKRAGDGPSASRRDRETGAGILLQAYQRRPTRAEPLVALATMYREAGQNHLGYMAARQALDIPYPKDDSLFVDEPMHRRGALEEIAITGYYLGRHDEGMKACETLLGSKIHPPAFHDHIARCTSFYVQPIASKAVRCGEFTVPDAIRAAPGPWFGGPDPNRTTYNPSNPTIVQIGARYLTNIRLVNYFHERGRVFAPKDSDGIVRTRNVIQEWDPETGTGTGTAPRESVSDLPPEWDHETRVRGLEDQRWCLHEGRVWVTFTCFNIPSSHGMPQVALGRLKETEDGVEQVRALLYRGSGRYEKNWLPWSRAGELSLIYGYDPFRILRVDPATGYCGRISETPSPFATHRWRGSCAPVPSPEPGKYIGMIHETAWFEGEKVCDQRTVYMHRFFECTETELTRRSPLFTFDHSGVEYAAGLARLPNGNYVVTHSIEESSAHWKEFTWETIDQMLGAAP